MRKASSRSNSDANLEMLSLIYSFKLYLCQDHVEVCNGYVRARDVGLPPKTYLTENSSSANRILRPRFVRLAAFLTLLYRIFHNYSHVRGFYSFNPCRRQAKQPQFV